MKRGFVVFNILTLMRNAWILLFFAAPLSVLGVSFEGLQTGSNEWTYTLAYAPEDNYSIYQPDTTITIDGLFGVVSATKPTSTDFPDDWISQLNLE